jgi:hypothetical protein
MAVAKTQQVAFTDIRLSKRPGSGASTKPDVPASGSVRLYVRYNGTDTKLFALLSDNTEVAVVTLVTGGNLP